MIAPSLKIDLLSRVLLSRVGHEKSGLKLGRPLSKAKYVLRSIAN